MKRLSKFDKAVADFTESSAGVLIYAYYPLDETFKLEIINEVSIGRLM
jgi:hypothetical protein